MQADTQIIERHITELDFARLRKLSASQPESGLADVLEAAEVVPGPDIDPDVITMYTQFELEEADTHERRILAICYPEDAEPSSGFISVLSPLGSSLIGLRTGARAEWRTPSGTHAGSVVAVLFQPEASGDYVT